jgi:hypothetical protein
MNPRDATRPARVDQRKQATFAVVFRGAAGDAGVRALRRALKYALRACGLRAIHCQELRRKDDGGGA